jgi:hypothetical protein
LDLLGLRAFSTLFSFHEWFVGAAAARDTIAILSKGLTCFAIVERIFITVFGCMITATELLHHHMQVLHTGRMVI